jgi:hypothetical protein
MASLAKTFDFIYHRLTQPYNPKIAALQEKENEMAAALIRVHKTHLFRFLDLPKKIRTRIYSFIFAANIVTVCSYNKDRTSQFHSSDERCQILLTCQAIYKEAYRVYYRHSDWKFTKVSSLNYMAWGDGGAKLQLIQNVIITNRDVVAISEDYLHLFQNLKNLIVDFPTKLKLQKPLKQQDHARIVRRVKNGEWYKTMVGVYLPTAGKRNFNIKVGVQISHGDDSGNDQVSGTLGLHVCR